MSLPVVINADLIKVGDQLEWNDLTYAAAVAWEHAIEVPEIILYCTFLLSPLTLSMHIVYI